MNYYRRRPENCLRYPPTLSDIRRSRTPITNSKAFCAHTRILTHRGTRYWVRRLSTRANCARQTRKLEDHCFRIFGPRSGLQILPRRENSYPNTMLRLGRCAMLNGSAGRTVLTSRLRLPQRYMATIDRKPGKLS